MFHPLRVSEVERLTDDSVAVTFAVPPELREAFRHVPGQHLTMRRTSAEGEEIRRTYSICSRAAGPGEDPVLRVGIRLVEGGEFSTYALKELAVGDTVEVMEPMGRFVLPPRPGHFAAIVGGSGITPCCRSRRRCWRGSRRHASASCAATARLRRRCSSTRSPT